VVSGVVVFGGDVYGGNIRRCGCSGLVIRARERNEGKSSVMLEGSQGTEYSPNLNHK
jgi:hypothetical protein